jgi:ethanolamine permease
MPEKASPAPPEEQLNRVLSPLMLWGLGVGYVISGMYFGWNLGLEQGGTLGLALATGIVIILYVTFSLGYAELACCIPKAGGALDYALKGLGREMGFICGLSQIFVFVFGPPAIAAAIGAYMHIFMPAVPVPAIAIVFFMLFTSLNIYGVKAAAMVELCITTIAVAGIILFSFLAFPHLKSDNLLRNPMPNGFEGMFGALPFAIWFFLGIEGLANVAEETLNPGRSMRIGFGSSITTLVLLCLLTFVASVGIDGWEAVVYPAPGAEASDSPLPLAVARISGANSPMHYVFTLIGLSGLVASFHGTILASGRSTFEFGRVGYAPAWLSRIHPRFRTPANALIANTTIGIVAILTGKTGDMIILSCFGALSLYTISMFSLFALRRRYPQMERPYRVPFYPYFPIITIVLALFCLVAVSILNATLALFYFGCLAAGYVVLRLVTRRKALVH